MATTEVDRLLRQIELLQRDNEEVKFERNIYREKLSELRRNFLVIEARNEILECDLRDSQRDLSHRGGTVSFRESSQRALRTNTPSLQSVQDPEELKVREWRHKLQQGFIDNVILDPSQMTDYDVVLTAVEGDDKLTKYYLEFPKLVRVLRHIIALPDEKLLRNDEFRFRERAKALVDKWEEVLTVDKTAAGAPSDTPSPTAEEIEARPKTMPDSASLSPTKATVPSSPTQMNGVSRTSRSADVERMMMNELPASSSAEATTPAPSNTPVAFPTSSTSASPHQHAAQSALLPASSPLPIQIIPLPKRKRKVDSIQDPEIPAGSKAIRTLETTSQRTALERRETSPRLPWSPPSPLPRIPSPVSMCETLNRFRVKVEEAIMLPNTLFVDHLKDASTIVINPPPSCILYPRRFLNWAYGTNMMHLLSESRDGARNFILPAPDVNPQMPRAPGQTGVLLTGRNEMLQKTWSLFSRVRENPPKWLYMGEYKHVRVGALPREEFSQQRRGVKYSWAAKIMQNREWSCYSTIRARIWLRLTGRVLTDSSIRREVTRIRGGAAGKLSEEDVVKAFESGQEHVDIIRMDCVSYDHAFVQDMKARWHDWESREDLRKKKKPERGGSESVTSPRPLRSTRRKPPSVSEESGSDSGDSYSSSSGWYDDNSI